VVKAYRRARTSQNEGIAKIREEFAGKRSDPGPDRPVHTANRGGRGAVFAEVRQRTEALAKAEVERLREALLEAGLTPPQTDRAMVTLGSFSRQWDMIVARMNEFELPEARSEAAHEAVHEYIATLARVDRTDRGAMREVSQDAREKLRKDLASVLSEEQLEQLRRWTARGVGGARARGRG